MVCYPDCDVHTRGPQDLRGHKHLQLAMQCQVAAGLSTQLHISLYVHMDASSLHPLTGYSITLLLLWGEPEEEELRSELKHDSCSVSLSGDLREGGWRKRWENDSVQRKWIQAFWCRQMESLVKKVEMGRGEGRDNRRQWQVLSCKSPASSWVSSLVGESLPSRSQLSISLCGEKK